MRGKKGKQTKPHAHTRKKWWYIQHVCLVRAYLLCCLFERLSSKNVHNFTIEHSKYFLLFLASQSSMALESSISLMRYQCLPKSGELILSREVSRGLKSLEDLNYNQRLQIDFLKLFRQGDIQKQRDVTYNKIYYDTQFLTVAQVLYLHLQFLF